jgi:ligand-binding SRPBCC domain-containing protein
MPLIHLTTFIAAPVERVFDLSRSIDFHKASMKKFNETPVEGRMEGLIELNESVGWKARILGKERFLKSKITALTFPEYFVDEQEKGDFGMLKHEHYFKPIDNGTLMIDKFYFETPYGSMGKIFAKVYLNRFMQKLLEERNQKIKAVAEGDQWKLYLTK